MATQGQQELDQYLNTIYHRNKAVRRLFFALEKEADNQEQVPIAKSLPLTYLASR
jgi:hypothetical protein